MHWDLHKGLRAFARKNAHRFLYWVLVQTSGPKLVLVVPFCLAKQAQIESWCECGCRLII